MKKWENIKNDTKFDEIWKFTFTTETVEIKSENIISFNFNKRTNIPNHLAH